MDSTGKRKEISIQFQYSKACVSALYDTCPFSKDSIQDNVFNSSRFAFRGQRNEKYFPNENASGPSGLAIYCPKIYPIRDPIHFPSFYFPAKSGNERTTGREGLGQQWFQDGGGDGRASFQMDECCKRMAIPMVRFGRQYWTFILLHGQYNIYVHNVHFLYLFATKLGVNLHSRTKHATDSSRLSHGTLILTSLYDSYC